MITIFLFFLQSMINPTDSTGLEVVFTNIKQAQGQLMIAVYDKSEDYMVENKVRSKRVVPVTAKGTITCLFPELGPGTYAISCFHDLNSNGKLDTNFLGIPSEPYGASNNARPKFRAPNWEETRFELKKEGTTISIRLEKW